MPKGNIGNMPGNIECYLFPAKAGGVTSKGASPFRGSPDVTRQPRAFVSVGEA